MLTLFILLVIFYSFLVGKKLHIIPKTSLGIGNNKIKLILRGDNYSAREFVGERLTKI